MFWEFRRAGRYADVYRTTFQHLNNLSWPAWSDLPESLHLHCKVANLTTYIVVEAVAGRCLTWDTSNSSPALAKYLFRKVPIMITHFILWKLFIVSSILLHHTLLQFYLKQAFIFSWQLQYERKVVARAQNCNKKQLILTIPWGVQG